MLLLLLAHLAHAQVPEDPTLDWTRILAETRCSEAAQALAESQAQQQLEAEVLRLQTHARDRWAALQPELAACTVPAEHAHCVEAAAAYIVDTDALVATLPGGFVVVSTGCGRRPVRLEARQLVVHAPEVDAARQALLELELRELDGSDLPPFPRRRASLFMVRARMELDGLDDDRALAYREPDASLPIPVSSGFVAYPQLGLEIGVPLTRSLRATVGGQRVIGLGRASAVSSGHLGAQLFADHDTLETYVGLDLATTFTTVGARARTGVDWVGRAGTGLNAEVGIATWLGVPTPFWHTALGVSVRR